MTVDARFDTFPHTARVADPRHDASSSNEGSLQAWKLSENISVYRDARNEPIHDADAVHKCKYDVALCCIERIAQKKPVACLIYHGFQPVFLR